MKRRRDGEERQTRRHPESLSCLSLHQSQQDTREDGEDESVLMDGLKAICKTEEKHLKQHSSKMHLTLDAHQQEEASLRKTSSQKRKESKKKHHSIWNEKEGGVDGDEVLVIRVLLFLI